MAINFAELIFYWIFSLMTFFLSFYIPGRVVVRKLTKVDALESLVLSVFLGISLWGLEGYIFGYLNMRFLTYPYLLGSFYFWIKNLSEEKNLLKKGFRSIITDKWLILILLLGIPVCVSTVFTSGLPQKGGVGFFGINPIDGSYHIALIKSLVREIPPEEPGMANTLLANYHYWSDMILAELVRIFKLPVVNLFYHYFPTFLAFFYGLCAYIVGKLIAKDVNVGRFFTFFVFFAGNLGYLFMYVLTGNLTFTVASLDNAALVFTNPPRVLAQAVFLAGVIAVYKWLTMKKLQWGFVSSILLGVCVGMKVYVGIFACLGLGVLFFWFLYKKQYLMMLPIFMTALLSAAIFFPTNSGAGGLFWSPYSWPRHFFAQGTLSQLMWHLQEDEFVVHNNNLRIFLLHIQMTVSFLFITFGTRILGIIGVACAWRKLDRRMFLFLVVPSIVFVFVGVFFLQESGVFESFNFIAVASLVASFFTAYLLSLMIERARLTNLKIGKYIYCGLLILIVGLTLPRTFYDARNYVRLFKLDSGQILSWEDISFFDNMRDCIPTKSLVLTDNRDSLGNYSPYIAAFSGRRMYFSGEGILKAHGLEVDKTNIVIKNLFNGNDPKVFSQKAKELGIEYIYLNKPEHLVFASDIFFEQVLESEKNIIFRLK